MKTNTYSLLFVGILSILSACQGNPFGGSVSTPLAVATRIPVTLPPTPTATAAAETVVPVNTDPPATVRPSPTRRATSPVAATQTPIAAEDSVIPIATAKSQLGTQQTIRGIVIVSDSYKFGFKFTVEDDSDAITLLLPSDIYIGIDGVEGLRVGAEVEATGEIGSYREELQLEPRDGKDVLVKKPAPSSTEVVAIDTIGIADIDRVVTVEGDVKGYTPFSSGYRMEIVDETGRITLILWSNVADFVPDFKQLALGPRVRVTGKLAEYRGKMEILPALGYDVVLLTEE